MAHWLFCANLYANTLLHTHIHTQYIGMSTPVKVSRFKVIKPRSETV